MKNYYIQILCKYCDTGEWFIEEGILDDHGDYLVYRDLKQGYGELYDNLNHFKKSMVYDLRDFKKYCTMLELK
jgi:hypothetical protein